MAVEPTIVLLTTLNKIGANMSGLVEYSADARSKTIGNNFRVRAWVRADGSGTIEDSGNVTSISHSTGHYTVNFATAMPSNKFCAVATKGYYGTNNDGKHANWGSAGITTTTAQFIYINPGVNYYNVGALNAVIFC